MKLRELKEIAVKLIDEFTTNNITDDEDIKNKLNTFFNIAQMEVAQTIKIYKKHTIENIETEEAKYTLPDDFWKLKSVKGGSYVYEGKEIVLYNKGDYEIEYNAYPTIINSDTSDEFELEIPLEGQLVLPYYVASDILKSDTSADYSAFEAKYSNKLINTESNSKAEIVKLF